MKSEKDFSINILILCHEDTKAQRFTKILCPAEPEGVQKLSVSGFLHSHAERTKIEENTVLLYLKPICGKFSALLTAGFLMPDTGGGEQMKTRRFHRRYNEFRS